jgi:hypothetical protein
MKPYGMKLLKNFLDLWFYSFRDLKSSIFENIEWKREYRQTFTFI